MGARGRWRARAALAVVALGALAAPGCSLVPVLPLGPPAAGQPAPLVPREDDDVFGPSEAYVVDEDARLHPSATGRADAIWDLFVRVATPELAGSRIGRYLYADDPRSDTYAYVHFEDVEAGRWRLAANGAYADDPELLLGTLVHEYAHVLSLHTDQYDAVVLTRFETCDTLEADGGCLREDAWLTDFHEEFWSGYGAAAPDADDTADAGVRDAFYADHADDFVSAYAATNVTEDFAETFMTFVLEPNESLADPSSSMVARKLAFLAGIPQLSAIRDRIRAEFRLGR